MVKLTVGTNYRTLFTCFIECHKVRVKILCLKKLGQCVFQLINEISLTPVTKSSKLFCELGTNILIKPYNTILICG